MYSARQAIGLKCSLPLWLTNMAKQRVKLLKHWMGHDPDQLVEIEEDIAQSLIKRDWAVPQDKHVEGSKDKMIRKVKTK